MPSVIVLDLDDTLYLERDYALSGFRAVGRWLRDRHGVMGFADRAAEQFAVGNHTHVFDATLHMLGITPSAELIAQLIGVYRRHRPQIGLLDDAERLFDRRPAGCSWALLTDGFLVAQRNKIRALGLRRRPIQPIVCTDIWGAPFWKPHRRGFELIVDTLACPAARFIYVADNPAKDFIAPRALGWATVQIRRDDGIHCHRAAAPDGTADVMIETLDELTDALVDDLVAGRSR